MRVGIGAIGLAWRAGRRVRRSSAASTIRRMTTRTLLSIVRAGSIILVLAAIVAQALVLADSDAFDPTRFFAFFTILSNCIGVAAFAWLLATRDGPRSRSLELLRAASAVYLTITFFVVIFLLSGIDVQLQLVWVDVVLHKVFPVIVVADWLLDPPQHRLTPRDIVTLLLFPLIWTVLTMIRGAIDGWDPYPFLDPATGGYGQVLVVAAVILVAFVAVTWLVIELGNRRAATTAAVRA